MEGYRVVMRDTPWWLIPGSEDIFIWRIVCFGLVKSSEDDGMKQKGPRKGMVEVGNGTLMATVQTGRSGESGESPGQQPRLTSVPQGWLVSKNRGLPSTGPAPPVPFC